MQLCVHMCVHKGTAEAGCACLYAPLRKNIYGNRYSRCTLGGAVAQGGRHMQSSYALTFLTKADITNVKICSMQPGTQIIC